MESPPGELADLRHHPEARLLLLLFRAVGSGGPHVYSHTLAEDALRLARGLQVRAELEAAAG